MTVATFQEILGDASERQYAVGSFNVWDIYSAKHLAAAAERMASPVIFSLWQTELDLSAEGVLWGACRQLAEAASVPIALFIDHAKTLAEIERAIDFGASSVMIDGSDLSLAENIELTRRAAEIAHGAGVSIEGEIGVLGEEGQSDPDEAFYADVDEAAQLVEATGIDALAVAIGNAHGFYREEPRLDFARLTSIRERVDVPLVLHGGSGLPDADISRAISLGISKVNIGAEIRKAYMAGLRASLQAVGPDERFPHLIYPPAFDGLQVLAVEKMELFRSTGKAAGSA
jgi:ketose-bisphosphate aldolase